jgi:hypothetical protein
MHIVLRAASLCPAWRKKKALPGLAGPKPKLTAYEIVLLILLDRDLFGVFFFLFLFRKEKFQHTIVVFSLNTIGIDAIIQVKSAFKALEREFLTDSLIFFRLRFFLLIEGNGQLAFVDGELEILFCTARSAQFQMIGFFRLMDIHGRKSEIAFTAPGSGEVLEKSIYEIGQVPCGMIVNFYECHSEFLFLILSILFDRKKGTNCVPWAENAAFQEFLADLTKNCCLNLT